MKQGIVDSISFKSKLKANFANSKELINIIDYFECELDLNFPGVKEVVKILDKMGLLDDEIRNRIYKDIA